MENCCSTVLLPRGAGYYFKKEATDGHFDWAKPGTTLTRRIILQILNYISRSHADCCSAPPQVNKAKEIETLSFYIRSRTS